ncbi:MAG: TolB family protein, partial [Planctomycetota bacterium]
PDKPSTRLSAMGEVLAEVAKHRKVSPDILAKLLRGDLDLIIMKTLEKDRTRRYERAVELAADVDRHLNHKPVLAAPPSMTYRLRKFVRRNRVAVITCSLITAALAVGATITALTLLTSGRLTGRIDQSEFARIMREHLEQLDDVAKAKLVWAYPTLMDVTALSPDGHYLAFRDQDTGDLAIRDLKTGENRRLTHNKVPFEATTIQARFSPDGEWIAYNWYYFKEGRQKPDLRIVRIDGSGLRTVYKPDGDVKRISPYAWFPDGKQILGRLLRDDQRRQAVVVSVADSSVSVIEGPDREYEHLSLSPDGRYIAYNFYPNNRSGSEDIAVLPVDGGPEIPVIEDPADDDLLGWTPDGRMLVFRSNRGGEGDDAWVIQIIDGKPQGLPQLVRKRIDKEGAVEYGQFTRDGSFYFPIQKSTPGRPAIDRGLRGLATDVLIATLNPNTGKVSAVPKSLTERTAQRVISPAFSRDGKHIAYYIVPPFKVLSQGVRQFVGSGQVFIRSLVTGQEREITLSPKLNGGLPHIHWSPDGRSFLIGGSDERGQSGIYRADTHTGKLSPLVLNDPQTTGDWLTSHRPDSEGDYVTLGQLSPDGKTLFYLREHFDPNAPGLRAGQTGDFTQARILARDIETGREREVYRNPEGVVGGFGFTISPDGQWIAIRAPWGASTMLKVVPATGGEPRELLQLQEPEHIRGVVWTPDGRYLLFLFAKMRTSPLRNSFSLWRISAEGGEPEQVHEFDERLDGPPPIFGLRIHPDGNLIAFVGFKGAPQIRSQQQDQELWVLENFLPELASRPVQLPNPPEGNYFITRSEDDAEERPNGVTDLDNSDLDLGQISGVGENVSCAGIRFEGIRIPKGTEIKKAFLQFTKDGPDSEAEPSELTIHAELSANAETFIEAKHNISSRKRTKASVEWSPEGWTIVGERSQKQRTHDLSSLIQEVVTQSGWQEGNSLVLIITGSGERDAMSFDGGGQRYAPMLHIEH